MAGVHVFITGESLHCFLVGVQIKVIATSDLWRFIHASNLLPSTPHPTPLQNLALLSRIGSRRVTHQPGDSVEELSEGTGRQCSGAVWRHWGQCSGTVWHGGSSRGPDHRTSPTLMADLQQLQQQKQALRPVLAAWPARSSNIKERSTRWCSSTLDGTWRMGSSVVGRLTNVVVPLNSWFGPAHFGLMSQEKWETTSAAARDALWCHALGKRKGIWCLV